MRATKRDHWIDWTDKMLTKVMAIKTETEPGSPERLTRLQNGKAYSRLLRLSIDGQAQFTGHPGARRRG